MTVAMWDLLRLQDLFNIATSIDLILPINSENHMVISTDTEKYP